MRSALQEEWRPLLAWDLVSLQLPLGRRRGRLASALCLWNPARLEARILFSGRRFETNRSLGTIRRLGREG